MVGRAIALTGCLAAGLVLAGCGGQRKIVTQHVVITHTTSTQQQTTPASSGQAIELYRGIAGISVGMSKREVTQRLGAPVSSSRQPGQAGTITRERYPGGLTVSMVGDSVTAVETTSAAPRTAGGLGVGSSEQEVRRLPSVSCQMIAGQYGCQIGRSVPGATVNVFTITAGRVTRVMIARVID